MVQLGGYGQTFSIRNAMAETGTLRTCCRCEEGGGPSSRWSRSTPANLGKERIGVDELILILKKEICNRHEVTCISENRGGGELNIRRRHHAVSIFVGVKDDHLRRGGRLFLAFSLITSNPSRLNLNESKF